MAKTTLSEQEQVSAHIAKLDPVLQPVVEYLRASILRRTSLYLN